MEGQSPEPLDRRKVKALHEAIIEVLKKVAEEQGFIYEPSALRFNDIDVTGKMKFILKGREEEALRRESLRSSLSERFPFGERVSLSHDPGVEYRVRGFKGKDVLILRVSDGKTFRANPDCLTKHPG